LYLSSDFLVSKCAFTFTLALYRYRLALVASLVRRDPSRHVHLLAAPFLAEHVSPKAAAGLDTSTLHNVVLQSKHG
jgi:hypothetical protein